MITNLKIDEERKRLYYQQGYWTEETLYDVWNRQARACADREYVVDDRGTVSYTHLDVYKRQRQLRAPPTASPNTPFARRSMPR